jgi:hypothetical protein
MPPFDDFSSLEHCKMKPEVPSLLNRIIISCIKLHHINYGYIPTGTELMNNLTIKKLGLNTVKLNSICDKYRYLMSFN